MPDHVRGTPAGRHDLAMTRLLTFYRARTGRWRTPTGENWQPALALEAVLGALRRTGEPGYRTVLRRSFARYRGRRSRFYDDNAWYLITWLDAHDLTGEPAYLQEARALFADLVPGWDEYCGGGLWWRRERDYKNAITNGLFLLAAAGLARRAPGLPGASDYRDWALRCWRWFDSTGMINPSHLVNDGIGDDCRNNGRTTWSYNQGVVLGALTELWRLEGDPSYLDRSRQIADATITTLVDAAGVLAEPGEPHSCGGDHQVFKGVFVHNLARLYHADPPRGQRYRQFLTHNADTLWRDGRDAGHGFGLVWAGPSGAVTAATQTAGCLLLGEVALLDVDPARPG